MPEITIDTKRNERRSYRWSATPSEILRQLSEPAGFLRADLTAYQMRATANQQSDTTAAIGMQAAKHKRFDQLQSESAKLAAPPDDEFSI